MRIAPSLVFALLFASAITGCPQKKPDPTPGPVVTKAEIEPGDGGVTAWPGWPLPPGETVTPTVLCHIFFSPTADLHDACARGTDPFAAMRSYMEEARADCVPRLERSVRNGRAEIPQEAAASCVDKMLELRRSGRTEAPGTPWEHACDGMLVGRQAAGAACREEWECAPGLACQGFHKNVAGKCALPSGPNRPCSTSDLHLRASVACEGDSYCAADTCRPRDNVGATCTLGSCAAGSFCSSGTHLCTTELSPADAACSRHEDCAVGLYCAIKKCAPQHAAGAKCLDSIECKGDCKNGKCVGRCGSG